MFNDKYGLTDAVLQGRKTMTRRIIRNLSDFNPRQDWINWGNNDNGKASIAIFHNMTYKCSIYTHYQPGEVVAVAQAYNKFINELPDRKREYIIGFYANSKGWSNKMFVRADLMPHRIRITDIKVERLQEISDEDCLSEGLVKGLVTYGYRSSGVMEAYSTPRNAFAALIDKISGAGTWERNPWVFAYTFMLVD